MGVVFIAWYLSSTSRYRNIVPVLFSYPTRAQCKWSLSSVGHGKERFSLSISIGHLPSYSDILGSYILQHIFLYENALFGCEHSNVHSVITAFKRVDDMNAAVLFVKLFDGHKTSLINAGGRRYKFNITHLAFIQFSLSIAYVQFYISPHLHSLSWDEQGRTHSTCRITHQQVFSVTLYLAHLKHFTYASS